MSTLILDVGGWRLEVAPHGPGFQVSIVEDTKPATHHYVRLDKEQSEFLREFLNVSVSRS